MIELLLSGVKASDEEAISECLTECGALAITLMDAADLPILEPLPGETPLWPEIKLQALFDEANLAELAQDNIQQYYPSIHCNVLLLKEENWENAWQINAKPVRFGRRLWVCPSITPPPEPQAVNIILDPGLAFGTGSHPTTALCLTWLDAQNLAGKSVIDYGCGSGILGLAALKLGADKVYAIDIDKQALEATKQNAIQNEIDLSQLTIGALPAEPVDIIVANILLLPLIELKPVFCDHLKPTGLLVVTGILKEQVSILKQAYAGSFIQQNEAELDNWFLLAFKCI